MSPTDIHIVHAAAVHRVRVRGGRRSEELPVTVTVTPRNPAATARHSSLPTVRELPPVARPGTFASTW